MTSSRGPQSPRRHDEVRIRTSRPGDLGWVFHRHGVLYHAHGYAPVFERYVAEGLAPFLRRFDAERDALWLAEDDRATLGSVAIQHDPDEPGLAQLRWFLVEPSARGKGIGGRLLDTAVRFARQAGYKTVHLWTVDDLDGARRLYQRAGFTLAAERPDCPWKPGAKEQRWTLPVST